MMAVSTSQSALFTSDELLHHWEGHRQLTRRTIGMFPDEQLFIFTPAPPMRSFGVMMREVIDMLAPTLSGLTTKTFGWNPEDACVANTTEALLSAWDRDSGLLHKEWARLPEGRLLEVEAAFGFPEQPLANLVLYLIDNEVHRRAQGYVYLRLLGIEPPLFHERS